MRLPWWQWKTGLGIWGLHPPAQMPCILCCHCNFPTHLFHLQPPPFFSLLSHHLKDLGQYCTKGKSHSVPGETKNRELHLIPCSAQGEERQKLHSFPGRREEKHRVIYTVIRRETGLEYRKVNTS